MPGSFLTLLCDLVGGKSTPRYHVDCENLTALGAVSHLVKGWGDRFFWSEGSQTFVVQLLATFEYSNRSRTSQIFFSGRHFENREIREDEKLVFLPDRAFKEVFPEMHPDR